MCCIMAIIHSWIVRLIRSATLFCSELYGVVSPHLILHGRQKLTNSSNLKSPPLSDHRHFSFWPDWFSTFASHCEKIENTWSFVLTRYDHTLLIASSMNVMNYDALSRDWCGIGPQTSEWTKSSGFDSLGSLVRFMVAVCLPYWECLQNWWSENESLGM